MSALKQYGAGRDFISAAKLNYFHHFLKQLTGWTLHPRIQVASEQTCRIGDMGTQTAVWAIDAAEDPKLNATVHAFDVSDKFFPPREWLPRDLSLHVHDIRHPFPEELLGTFDVVHFRLFLMLDAEKLRAMIASAVTLLKPGGCIQWLEHDKTNLRSVSSSAGQDTSAADAFIEVQQSPFPNYDATWVNSIAPTMAAMGLEIVVEERIQTRPSLLTQMNELHLLSLTDIPAGLSDRLDQFKEKHFDALVEDSAKGVAIVDSFLVVVARKS